MSDSIGYLCLNIALVLYLIHYLPQLQHNRNIANRSQLNPHFHGLLAIANLSDLIFGFGMNMPWQYCLVSAVGVGCMMTQHMQLKSLLKQHKSFLVYQFIIGALVMIFFISLYIKLPKLFFLSMGYVCQAAIWTYTLPQIWQNQQLRQARGLNRYYLSMTWFCYLLDVIAATTLDWPIPAKMGAFYGLACTTVLFYQMVSYRMTMSEQMT